ncbi:MAG: RNA polymerase factor sigma-54 [Bacteroidota bacterium]
MLKQGMHQKMLLRMSPQQIQLMKLLQIPAANLEERIKEELEANPALEEGMSEDPDEKESVNSEDDVPEEPTDEIPEIEKPETDDTIDDDSTDDITDTSVDDNEVDITDYMDEDEVADYSTRGDAYSEDEEKMGVPIPVQRSFHEYLEEQAGLLEMPEEDLELVHYLIGSIDEDGYLRRPIDAMVDDLSFSQNIQTTFEKLEELLKIVQQLEPAGVGARNLSECLLLQLKRKQAETHTEIDTLAIEVITKYFDEFVKKHYDKLQKGLEIDDKKFKLVMNEIIHLNPKPGSAFAGSPNSEAFIVPDFFITNNEGKLEITLHNMNIPELRISNAFKAMMKDYKKSNDKKSKEALIFIKQKMDSAKWFIDAITQRYNTLYAVMHTIMEYQYEFFLTGDETQMRPMILKDIAERIGMDISTISRVANSKYVQTEFATYKLKFFFSESLSTDSGEEVSTREVKKILSDLIDLEDKKKPLADERLTELLREKGYNIARRTVAKYREQLNIPVARLRREL